MFWVECLKCGKIYKAYSTHIIHSKIEACLKCSMMIVSERVFNGCGDISLGYWNSIKRGSAGEKSSRKSRRTKKFEVTIEDAWDLFLKQNRKCALSGVDIYFVKYGSTNKRNKATASLELIVIRTILLIIFSGFIKILIE